MCGICGIRRFADAPIGAEQIRILLIGNERRGNQATGVALQQFDGSVQVFKTDDPASKFVLEKAFEEFLTEYLKEDTLTVLGHTRAATKGLPIYNKNNHPMWDETVAVVHNGVIYNDDMLFREMELTRVAETDSDIFRAILREEGITPKGINTLNKIGGSAAIAAVSTDYPGKLLLARSGNPIVIATTEHHMLWSSEQQPIYNALRPFYRRFGIWQRKIRADAGFMPMPNDTAWIIGSEPGPEDNWVEWHDKFRVAMTYTAPRYNVSDTYWNNWQKSHGGEKQRMIQCVNGKCMAWLTIRPDQRGRLEEMTCGVCKSPLKRGRK